MRVIEERIYRLIPMQVNDTKILALFDLVDPRFAGRYSSLYDARAGSSLLSVNFIITGSTFQSV